MKKKLLVVSSSYPLFKGDFNGIFVHELVKNLVPDYQVYVIAPLGNNSSKEGVIDNVTVYRHRQFPLFDIDFAYGIGISDRIKQNPIYLFVVPFFILYQLILLCKIIKKEKINTIHAFWLIPQAGVAVILKKLFFPKLKIVCSILGADINSFNSFFGAKLKKHILKNIEVLITQSLPMADKAKELGYSKKIYHYPLSVDTDKYHPNKHSSRIRTIHHVEGKILLYVATLTERKGIRYLIESLPIIILIHPKVKLLVIGDGDLRGEMEQLSEDLGVKNNVTFLGFLSPDVLPEYFASCDLFILPSLSEGFPLVVFSAISSGAVTLVTDLPVFVELEKTQPGILQIVENQNPEALAKKVVDLLNNFTNYKALAERNRQYVVENYSSAVMALKYKQLLKNIDN